MYRNHLSVVRICAITDIPTDIPTGILFSLFCFTFFYFTLIPLPDKMTPALKKRGRGKGRERKRGREEERRERREREREKRGKERMCVWMCASDEGS